MASQTINTTLEKKPSVQSTITKQLTRKKKINTININFNNKNTNKHKNIKTRLYKILNNYTSHLTNSNKNIQLILF